MTQSNSRPPLVIKYGGSVMTNLDTRQQMAARIRNLETYTPVVVHGGGPFIKAALTKAGVQSQFVRGLRVTDETSLPIIEATLTHLNKQLSQALGNAIGLTGRDANVLQARTLADLGFVGEVTHVNASLLNVLLEHQLTPVIACLAAPEGSSEGILNVNADSVAGAVAGTLAAPVVFLSDVLGVLDDPGDSSSLLRELSAADIHARIADGRIAGGMIPKVEAALATLAQGAAFAIIADGRSPDTLEAALNGQQGTTIHT
ncbi:MAG: acetylglutamate kinase [Deinococcota bacterium]